jgi:hypothetical protein
MYSLPDRAFGAFSIIAVAIVIVGPFIAKSTAILSALETPGCAAGLASVVVRYDPGTMVHFVPQTTPLLDWAPSFHIGTLRSNVHDFPNFAFMDWALANIPPHHSMFYTLNYRSFRGVLVRADSAILPDPPALLEICGRWEENPELAQFELFYADSVAIVIPE